MAKSFYYLVDNLNSDNAQMIKQGLKPVSDIVEVRFHIQAGIIEVLAMKNVKDQIQIALKLAGGTLRREVTKKELY